jgi:hypothetical protein
MLAADAHTTRPPNRGLLVDTEGVVSKKLAIVTGVTLGLLLLVGILVWEVVWPWVNPTVTVNVVNESSQPAVLMVRQGKCGGDEGRVEPATTTELELNMCSPLGFDYEGPKSVYVAIPTSAWRCSWELVERGAPIVIREDGPSGCRRDLNSPSHYFD